MGVCRLRFGSHSLSSLRKAIRGTLVDLAKQTQVTNKHFAEFANIVRNADIRKAVQQIPTRVSSRQLEQAKSPVEDHETRGYNTIDVDMKHAVNKTLGPYVDQKDKKLEYATLRDKFRVVLWPNQEQSPKV